MPLEPAVLGDLAAKNGVVKSHRFLAVNTALPFIRNDTETIKRIEQFLQTDKLRVDIFALHQESSGQLVMAIDENRPVLKAGEKVTVDVVVRNLGVGHTFPGGTNDSNEGWLEFSLSTDNGDILAISGKLDADGHLDPATHVFKALLLDKRGNPIRKRNAQDIYVTVYANVIAPGTADIAHYEFVIPPELDGQALHLRARLLWRKFDRSYTEFAYYTNADGFKLFDSVPELPVTEIASDHVVVGISTSGDVPARNGDTNRAPAWQRYNDYGIGLLLEGNTKAAAAAFSKVEELKPNSIEGPLNLAKTAVRDGSIRKAYEKLRRCEEIKRGDARVAWVWGVALQEDGQYNKAVQAYKRVLEMFPEDRATWRNIGRSYFLNQDYDQAIQAFARVLQIDPEDRVAHYHIMLCYRALGRNSEAESAKSAYEFFSVDESAQEITRNFKLANPGANTMAQAIRTHRLILSTGN
jgi:Tfp pilus assembly protein PilF